MINENQNRSSANTSQDFVLFGALGNLSLKKLLPAMYQLELSGLLDKSLVMHCVVRDGVSASELSSKITKFIKPRLPKGTFNEGVWSNFIDRIKCINVDLEDPSQYKKLTKALHNNNSVVTYYFALPPRLFEVVCDNLYSAGIIYKSSKIVIEKPIGRDYESSQKINDKLADYFEEERIYRIDHYLGKETVQNLIALRFANSILSNLWNSKNIEYVEITATETIGIEDRWGYYDGVGQMRDMLQSHLLQLLCLVAMEPPNHLNSLNVRYEKEQVLKALEPITDNIIRAQYVDGEVSGKSVPGYLNEEGGSAQSDTETYICMRAEISNWRWSGTPFYLRTGKRLANKVTEIVIHFKPDQHFIFDKDQKGLSGNSLIIRLQPTEGISIDILTKDQGIEKGMRLRKDPLNLDFVESQKVSRIPDAYEKLILEMLNSEQRLFVSRNEVELAWKWCDQAIQISNHTSQQLHHYSAGSNGPDIAKEMIQKYGHRWHEDR
ncbi:MAG TPA: glucose-6-phosphate dehydrogenase [Gammaproteobacteria bacterium]|nr:glucose-6-phosphate dehydrogenase [Gammaproteobacteria bacterium]